MLAAASATLYRSLQALPFVSALHFLCHRLLPSFRLTPQQQFCLVLHRAVRCRRERVATHKSRRAEFAPKGQISMSLWDPVYKLVKQIPRGRVLSYGAVAKILRLPGGARSSGRAMAATPSGKGVPWHRVLAANGKILIREPYSSLQRKLLESEGIEVVESRVRMKKYLWTPPAKIKKSSAKSKSARKRK